MSWVWLHQLGKLYGVRFSFYFFYNLTLLSISSFSTPISTCLIIISFVVYAGKYAQVTNNPENDGCINAVLLV